MTIINSKTTVEDLKRLIIEDNKSKEILEELDKIMYMPCEITKYIKDKYDVYLSTLKNELLYLIFMIQIENNIKINIIDAIKDIKYIGVDLILSQIDDEDENYDILLKYFIDLWFRKDITEYYKRIIEEIKYLLNKNIDLSPIEDVNLLNLLGYVDDDNLMDSILKHIKDVNEVRKFDLHNLQEILLQPRVLNKLLENGLNLNNLYLYNLNLLSLSIVCIYDIEILRKFINLVPLSLVKIDNKIFSEDIDSVRNYNLIEEIQMFSSLENFEDFININLYFFMKICDEETMRYIISLL